MSSFAQKVIAITGAGSGMGRSTALLLASKGASLSIADINAKGLAETEEKLKASGAKVLSTTLDVRKSSDVNQWIASTKSHFGGLDGAANLAGVHGNFSGSKLTEEMTDEEWAGIFEVNVHGMFHCVRAELQNMEKGAAIVNAASVVSYIAVPKMSAYVATKHAVAGLTKVAAKEAAAKGIRVNAVAPGDIDTPFVHHMLDSGTQSDISPVPIGRRGKPEEVAEFISFLLSDEASYVAGSLHVIDGALIT